MLVDPGLPFWIYAAAGAVTGAYVVSEALRWIPRWLSKNPPEGREDRAFVPALVVLVLVGALSTAAASLVAWPVVLYVVIQEKRRAREGRRLQEEAEERALLGEIRQLRGTSQTGVGVVEERGNTDASRDAME